MPLFGRRKEAPPSVISDSVPRPSSPLASDADIAAGAEVRFRVSDIYVITGIGCIAVGVLEAGVIRPPVVLRIAHQTGSLTDGLSHRVTVVKAEGHRTELSEVLPGANVGLALRSADGAALSPKELRKWMGKGDLLVSE